MASQDWEISPVRPLEIPRQKAPPDIDVWKNYAQADPRDRSLEKDSLYRSIEPILGIVEEYKEKLYGISGPLNRLDVIHYHYVPRELALYEDYRQNLSEFIEELNILQDAIFKYDRETMDRYTSISYTVRPAPLQMTRRLWTDSFHIPDPSLLTKADGSKQLTQEQIDTIHEMARRARDHDRTVGSDLFRLISLSYDTYYKAQSEWKNRVEVFGRCIAEILRQLAPLRVDPEDSIRPQTSALLEDIDNAVPKSHRSRRDSF